LGRSAPGASSSFSGCGGSRHLGPRGTPASGGLPGAWRDAGHPPGRRPRDGALCPAEEVRGHQSTMPNAALRLVGRLAPPTGRTRTTGHDLLVSRPRIRPTGKARIRGERRLVILGELVRRPLVVQVVTARQPARAYGWLSEEKVHCRGKLRWRCEKKQSPQGKLRVPVEFRAGAARRSRVGHGPAKTGRCLRLTIHAGTPPPAATRV